MRSKAQLNDKQLQRLRAQVYDVAPDSIYFYSMEDFRILDANPYAIEALGYVKEELLQMSYFDLCPQEEHIYVHEAISQLRRTGSFIETRVAHLKKKDGTLIPIQPNVLLLKIDDKEIAQCICRDVSARVRVEQELQEHARSLETLNTVTLDISSERVLHRMLLKIIKSAVDATGVDAGGIGLYDEGGNLLIKPFLYNFPKDLIEGFMVDGEVDPIAKAVMTTKQPLIYGDYPSSPYALEPFVKAGIKSVVYVPILAREKALGILGVVSLQRRRRFTKNEVELLFSIARHAGLAIENAILFAKAEEAKEDIEEVNKDLAIINNISLDISRGIELKETSQRIIDAAVKLVNGDLGGIVFYKEGSPYIYYHRMTREMREAIEHTLPGSISDIVIKTGKPVLLDDYPSHPGAVGVLVNMGVKSLVAAPLGIGGRTFGAIIVDSFTPKKFTAHDLSLLQGIAAQASIAIENARLYGEIKEAYEKERERTIILQKSLLPSKIPEIPGIEIATFYESATEAALIGGDFYDIIPACDGLIAFVIGDVSGKGIDAAATTAMIRNVVRSFAYQDPEPSSVLTKANDIIIKQIEPGMFITLIYLIYDQKNEEIAYVNAGHPYPFYCSAKKGRCLELENSDPAFGIFPGYRYSQVKEDFLPNDTLILYTDGLIEARRQRDFFGVERARSVVEKYKGKAAEEIAERLIGECKAFSESWLADDVAMLILKRI
ncbi:MAG: SpoIIE family protein phosphatase [Actinobacteria bacterium]|nr:SpoIIE family protein phosphatase [Actinomycetota bacterium]